tara:strand:+ start:2730 stop:2930 length:201 start_codon:yes stop_codon:yes gene_type:complete
VNLNDYELHLKLRCKVNPSRWIVDALYDTLDTKNNEDILYWDVKDLKPETNTNSTTKEVTKDEHND